MGAIVCLCMYVCMYDIQSVCMYIEEIPTKPSARYLLLTIKARLGQVSRTVLLYKISVPVGHTYIHTYIHTYMAACLSKQRHSDHSRTGTAARDQTRPQAVPERYTLHNTTYIHTYMAPPPSHVCMHPSLHSCCGRRVGGAVSGREAAG